MFKLMDTERRRSPVIYRPSAQVTILAGHKESRYPVQEVGEVYRTATAFGEPPARGRLLILLRGTAPGRGQGVSASDAAIFIVSIQDRALLDGFSMEDLSMMREVGLTDQQITFLVGGCVPKTMVFDTLLCMMQSLCTLVPPLSFLLDEQTGSTTEQQAQAAGEGPQAAQVQPPATSAPLLVTETAVSRGSYAPKKMLGWVLGSAAPPASQSLLPIALAGLSLPGSLVLVRVVPGTADAEVRQESRVVVDSSSCLPSHARDQSTPIPTGQVLVCFKQAFAMVDGEVVFLAELCSLHGSGCVGSAADHNVYVAAKLSPITQLGESIAYLHELAGSWSYRPASLALAMVAAHSGGHTDLATIQPMLDSTSVFSIGALTARSLAPSSLQLGCKTQSR